MPWRPALLLNATHQETGRRIITSHLKIEPDVFVDSYDALQTLGSDVRLSTAAHNSARFTYISPAGDLISAQAASGNLHGFVIDGGYFENYGAQTATELAHEAIEAIKSIDGATIRPVILQISSDPTVKTETLVRQRDCAKHDGDFLSPYGAQSAAWWDLSLFNELSAPLIGIMSVREAHGFIALSALAHLACDAPSTAEQPKQQAQNSIVHLYDSWCEVCLWRARVPEAFDAASRARADTTHGGATVVARHASGSSATGQQPDAAGNVGNAAGSSDATPGDHAYGYAF